MAMLEVKQITKEYKNGKGVFDCSFKAYENEVTGLIGNNGCGKTTTFRLVLGLIKPNFGLIEYQGVPLDRFPAKIKGYVPEERSLYRDCLVNEMIALMAHLNGVKRSEVNKLTDKWLDIFSIKPLKYRNLQSLSKGNQQLVQFISAIIYQPKILILDEPFTGLDVNNKSRLIEVIKEYKKEKIVLVSSHESELIPSLCDQVIHFKEGRICRE